MLRASHDMTLLRRRTRRALPLAAGDSLVCAAAAADAPVAATRGGALLCGDARAEAGAPVRALRVARVTALGAGGLPEPRALALALTLGDGVKTFALPGLEQRAAEELRRVSRRAACLAVDQLVQGGDSADTFRVALAFDAAEMVERDAEDERARFERDHPDGVEGKVESVKPAFPPGASVVSLYEVACDADRLELLGTVNLTTPVLSLAFGGFTLVATTPDDHCLVRVARAGSLALAASVPRYVLVPPRARRNDRGAYGTQSRSLAAQESAAAGLFSFIGGISALFSRRDGAGRNALAEPVFAIPMPEDRWLLVVDEELVAYSSFGSKVEDLDGVFKSKAGVELEVRHSAANLLARQSSSASLASARLRSSPGVAPGSAADLQSAGSRVGARPGLSHSASVSSLASATTVASVAGGGDEAGPARTDRIPVDTVFVSPFVLSMASDSDLFVFAANGSVSGALESVNIFEALAEAEEEKSIGSGDSMSRMPAASSADPLGAHGAEPSPYLSLREPPKPSSVDATVTVKSDPSMNRPEVVARKRDPSRAVRLIPTPAYLPRVAFAVWSDGEVAEIELVKSLAELSSEYELDGELRYALALVPAEDTERTLYLRRALAVEARGMNWHEGAIKHMETVVNLALKSDLYGSSQQDLVVEAVELRGPSEVDGVPALRDSSWSTDPVVASMWADFLYQLRRRIMRPSPSDVGVLETLCAVDVDATRLKKLCSVPHKVDLVSGERLITSSKSMLPEKERVSALVAFYKSLDEHDKALTLLEDSDTPVDEICEYLSIYVRAASSPEIYFRHLDWLASDPDRHEKLMQVLRSQLPHAASSRIVLTESLNTLVRGAPDLIPTYVEHVLTQSGEEPPAPERPGARSSRGESKTDILARALLSAMSTAQDLKRRNVVAQVRPIFRSQVLHRARADYDPKAMLAALREFDNLSLHEELAFLLGAQGQLDDAAKALAAEDGMSASDAIYRLKRDVPSAMHSNAAAALAAAYLFMAAKGKGDRSTAAAEIVASEHGRLNSAKVLSEASGDGDVLGLVDAREFAIAAISAGTERLRLAQLLLAVRKSEARRQREELLIRQRQHVVITRDRLCERCGRPIGESVFAAYPNGSVYHLACHMSSESPKIASKARF